MLFSWSGEHEKALEVCARPLQTEPQNNQAKELERLIDKAMKKGEGRPLLCFSASSPPLPALMFPWPPSIPRAPSPLS